MEEHSMTDSPEQEQKCTCGYAFGLRIQNLMCLYHGSDEFVEQRLPETPLTIASGIVRAEKSADTHDLRDK